MLGTSLALQLVTTLSAQGVVAATHVDPIPGGGSLTEVRVVQPMVMLHARALGDHLVLRGTLNLEGLTIPDGALTVGAWGEGFYDRRHPHTYGHEIMVSGVDVLGSLDERTNVSLSVGKGFVPFGSDDPMSRPALAFPVNHHWSHVLERAVAIAGVRTGPLLLEGALFNGDEPDRPARWPRVARFGDSWSLRVTLFPRPWIEVAASRAAVKSPEHRDGAGPDQQKWHLSARAERAVGAGRGYAMVEWARNTEADGFFVYTTALGEASWAFDGVLGYYRFERTERPEEARTLDLFRSQRPHLENTNLGTTRWSVHTAGSRMRLPFSPPPVRLEAVVEGSYAPAASGGGGLFQPQEFYGRKALWSLTVALRISAGSEHRMGRYGAAADAGHAH